MRDGNIALIADIGRIGKGPHILGLVQSDKLLVNLTCMECKKLLRFLGRGRHIGVDLSLVFAEIIDDILVVRERVEAQSNHSQCETW